MPAAFLGLRRFSLRCLNGYRRFNGFAVSRCAVSMAEAVSETQ